MKNFLILMIMLLAGTVFSNIKPGKVTFEETKEYLIVSEKGMKTLYKKVSVKETEGSKQYVVTKDGQTFKFLLNEESGVATLQSRDKTRQLIVDFVK